MNKSGSPCTKTVKEFLRAYVVLLVAPLLLLAPLILQGQVLFWGTPSLQFVSWWTFAWDALREGVLPLWNPLNGMGAPLAANYQSAFFYPPNLLLLAFAAVGGPAGIAWGFSFLLIVHIAWAGLGMALLLRQLGFGWLGQVIGGLAFALSGFIIGRAGFFSMVWVAAWLPWVILFADHIAGPLHGRSPARQKPFSVPLALTICLAMQLLAGHAQLTWYTLLLAAAWVTTGCLARSHWKQTLLAWAELAAGGLLAAGLAAVQLLPTFEYLTQSHRANAVAFDEAMTYSFWPWRFITILSPDFFGSPALGNFWGYASYWEDHLYLGMVPTLLALASVVLLVKALLRRVTAPFTPLLIFAWLLICAAFLLALGKNTPVFPFLYRYVPTFDMFQAPARYLVWVTFAIPLLAAASVERWRSPTGKGLYWFRLATAGAFAVTLGAGLAWLLMENVRLTFIRATALTGLWTLGFGLLTLAIPMADKYGRRPVWQWAVVLWTLADLLVAGWGLNPGVSPQFYQANNPSLENLPPEMAQNRLYMSRQEEYDLKYRRFMRFKDFLALEDWLGLRAVFLPDLNLLDQIPSANNFDPLVPERYARWMAEIETLAPEARESWLALMGVGAVERVDVREPYGVRFDAIPGARRWRWFACAQPASSKEEAWEMIDRRMQEGAPAWDDPVILEGWHGEPTSGCPSDPADQQGFLENVLVLDDRPGRLVLRVETPADGWFFLADTWYPGWQARVDGARADLYPANFLFRSVFLPAGNHQLSIIYRPVGFIFGGLFSILVLLFVIFLRVNRGRKTVRQPS